MLIVGFIDILKVIMLIVIMLTNEKMPMDPPPPIQGPGASVRQKKVL